MAENTSIEWCDHTFNPWIGCTRISPGCDNCYAAVSTPVRAMGLAWGAGEPRHRTLTWGLPKRWNAQHEAFQARYGRRQRVFCASLADVFDNEVPPEWRHDLFRLILDTPHLDWLVLTKRIGNVTKMLSADQWVHLGNVWLGVTVVNQEEAERDIPKLLATPARVRFLSMEPLLGPVDLRREWLDGMYQGEPYRDSAGGQHHRIAYGERLSWVIVGGESGKGARPMHPEWAAGLREQCQRAGVPFLFKQWGEWAPPTSGVHEQTRIPRESCFVRMDGSTHDYADDAHFEASDAQMLLVGKKAAGRLLDGRIHDSFPGAAE